MAIGNDLCVQLIFDAFIVRLYLRAEYVCKLF